MANVLLMPSLSPTMESGIISSWRKKVGEKVEVGQVLAEIETDKAVMEWEMADEGYLREFLVQTGQELKVGTPIAVLSATPTEDIAAAVAQAKSAAAAAAASAPAAAPAAPVSSAPAAPMAQVIPMPTPAAMPPSPMAAAPAAVAARAPGERVKISPYGKKIAEQAHVEWQGLAGSGPGGRIVAQDVQAAIASGGAAPRLAPAAAIPGAAYEDLPLSLMRKAIAKRMTESKQTVPHFQATRKVRMERLLDAREGLKRDFPDVKITVNDLLIKACATALMQHPAVNSQFLGDRIRRFHSADIAVAVGTDEGLVTPIIRAAHAKGLREIAAEMKVLGEKARDRKLRPEEYQGGTFSISNLGMFGITEFNAIINPPQACILAVSATLKEPVVEGDKLMVGQTMNITLSSDHRVVDGLAAAKFLDTLVKLIENPVAMVM
jgi:pyruvate dehydrogenase E2 component (dihydrolipoamide acetyltransferase)